MSEPIKLPPVHGHVELTPHGIEIFAALLHCVFAHLQNPVQPGTERHHANAVDYIRAHARGCDVERVGADAASATYTIAHGRSLCPLTVRILIGKPFEQCTEKLSGGIWVPFSLARFAVVA